MLMGQPPKTLACSALTPIKRVIGRDIQIAFGIFVATFATGLAVAMMPTFLGHVSGIVLGCTKEQMFRPNTRPVVALVQNPQSFRDGSYEKLVGDPVSFGAMAPYRNMPITMPVLSTLPKPTGISLFDMQKKAIFERQSSLGPLRDIDISMSNQTLAVHSTMQPVVSNLVAFRHCAALGHVSDCMQTKRNIQDPNV